MSRRKLIAERLEIEAKLRGLTRSDAERKPALARLNEINREMQVLRVAHLEQIEKQTDKLSLIAARAAEVMRLADHVATLLARDSDRRKFWTKLADLTEKERLKSFLPNGDRID